MVTKHSIRFQLDGTLGLFVKKGLDPQEPRLKAGGIGLDLNGLGVEDADMSGTFYSSSTSESRIISEEGLYIEFFKNLADSIKLGSASNLHVKPAQAALVVKIIEASIKSNAERKTIDI
jgi:predicted dehydrogenase